MIRSFLSFTLLLTSLVSFPQKSRFDTFISDTVMTNASVSFCVSDADSGEDLIAWNPKLSLIPASVMKLITSAAALELLGPDYTFRTTVGYTGYINRRTRILNGDIIIKGGGDPSLGSEYFTDHYNDFMTRWTDEIRKAGIKKIKGGILTDDSYFDYDPVSPRWLWEDLGYYYGAGVYGLSVFDNSCKIRLKSSPDSSGIEITGITPGLYDFEFTNRLTSSGNADNGYVFAAPYSTSGWLSGTIPATNEEFVLDGSIPDPPLLIARIMNDNLESGGIDISGEPSTIRVKPEKSTMNVTLITETISPPLSSIVEVLNRESVNLYAEHLVKEIGKLYRQSGTTKAGVSVIKSFLNLSGIDTTGMFIEDGSGLSSRNGINSEVIVQLLIDMRNRGKHFREYYSSLPDAGRNGTLSSYFKDPVFDSNLKAKSGSMTRVRCYAGYFSTHSGKNLAFSIIINNYQGTSRQVINSIEEILKEMILYK